MKWMVVEANVGNTGCQASDSVKEVYDDVDGKAKMRKLGKEKVRKGENQSCGLFFFFFFQRCPQHAGKDTR